MEVAQIIIHEADKPDIVVHFFDAEGLAGKDLICGPLTHQTFRRTWEDRSLMTHGWR